MRISYALVSWLMFENCSDFSLIQSISGVVNNSFTLHTSFLMPRHYSVFFSCFFPFISCSAFTALSIKRAVKAERSLSSSIGSYTISHIFKKNKKQPKQKKKRASQCHNQFLLPKESFVYFASGHGRRCLWEKIQHSGSGFYPQSAAVLPRRPETKSRTAGSDQQRQGERTSSLLSYSTGLKHKFLHAKLRPDHIVWKAKCWLYCLARIL